MSIAEYKTKDGYTLRVFSSMYMDWGLEILDPNGDEAYYSPHALSNESYGSYPPEDEDGEPIEDADEYIPWTQEKWIDALKHEANELIEALVPQCESCAEFVACKLLPVPTENRYAYFCKKCKEEE